MELSKKAIWASFWFAAALSLLCLIAHLAGVRWPGIQSAWIIPFLAFLPQSFFFVAMAQKQAQDRVGVLEERIRMLEARSPVS